MSVEESGSNPFISEKVKDATDLYNRAGVGDALADLLICADDENLTESEIAFTTILLLQEAQRESKPGNKQKVIEVYRHSLEALIKTGNLHTETYKQFFQQYNNFIALSL